MTVKDSIWHDCHVQKTVANRLGATYSRAMGRQPAAESQIQLTVRVSESLADRLTKVAEAIGAKAGVRVSPTEVHRSLLIGAIEAREKELGIKPVAAHKPAR